MMKYIRQKKKDFPAKESLREMDKKKVVRKSSTIMRLPLAT